MHRHGGSLKEAAVFLSEQKNKRRSRTCLQGGGGQHNLFVAKVMANDL
jgi:hypothetical protein